jgi:transcriptional regulator with XRE-family HTH domain
MRDSPPSPEGDQPVEEQTALNRYGRWVQALNTILGTTQPEIALQIGMSKGALSIATRGRSGAKRETIFALVEKYRQLANQQGIALPIAWDVFFVGSSWLESGELIEGADQMLSNLELLASVIKERDWLNKENERLKSKAFRRTVLAENEMLRREIERLRGEERNP